MKVITFSFIQTNFILHGLLKNKNCVKWGLPVISFYNGWRINLKLRHSWLKKSSSQMNQFFLSLSELAVLTVWVVDFSHVRVSLEKRRPRSKFQSLPGWIFTEIPVMLWEILSDVLVKVMNNIFWNFGKILIFFRIWLFFIYIIISFEFQI